MMNVSLKWLGTLVDIKGIDVEEMAETLTVDGIPVEHVMYPGRGISGVVIGKILEINKHLLHYRGRIYRQGMKPVHPEVYLVETQLSSPVSYAV